jgi:hypothetical protein
MDRLHWPPVDSAGTGTLGLRPGFCTTEDHHGGQDFSSGCMHLSVDCPPIGMDMGPCCSILYPQCCEMACSVSITLPVSAACSLTCVPVAESQCEFSQIRLQAGPAGREEYQVGKRAYKLQASSGQITSTSVRPMGEPACYPLYVEYEFDITYLDVIGVSMRPTVLGRAGPGGRESYQEL